MALLRSVCAFFYVISILTTEALSNFPLSGLKGRSIRCLPHILRMRSDEVNDGKKRRDFLQAVIVNTGALTQYHPYANAVERAVGSAELSCREAGDCLQKGDLDGAVGWNWGGKERCDATDPRCGPDGVLSDATRTGDPLPDLNVGNRELKITNVVDIEISIGRAEKGVLRIGFYGEACPSSVTQMIDFLGDQENSGILTSSKLMLEDGYGVVTSPVSFNKSGMLNYISPFSRLDFGVPSQAYAYARAKKLSSAGNNFVPQSRPSGPIIERITEEKSTRAHNIAGLVSIPKRGLGYGGNGLEKDDEAYSSAFQITAAPNPAMDKEGRKVIGQLMDNSSMAFLARLASLPTKKGFKGIIPGQNAGPPLVKVIVASTLVQSQSGNQSESNNVV